MVYLAWFWMVGAIFTAGLAWFLIPMSVHWETSFGVIHSWRIFTAICAMPSLICALCLYLCPESPRFLLTRGKIEEAKEIFAHMFKVNRTQSKTQKYCGVCCWKIKKKRGSDQWDDEWEEEEEEEQNQNHYVEEEEEKERGRRRGRGRERERGRRGGEEILSAARDQDDENQEDEIRGSFRTHRPVSKLSTAWRARTTVASNLANAASGKKSNAYSQLNRNEIPFSSSSSHPDQVSSSSPPSHHHSNNQSLLVSVEIEASDQLIPSASPPLPSSSSLPTPPPSSSSFSPLPLLSSLSPSSLHDNSLTWKEFRLLLHTLTSKTAEMREEEEENWLEGGEMEAEIMAHGHGGLSSLSPSSSSPSPSSPVSSSSCFPSPSCVFYCWLSIHSSLRSVWSRTVFLFDSAHLVSTLQLFTIWFSLSFAYYGLTLWIPGWFEQQYGNQELDIYLGAFLSACSNLPGNRHAHIHTHTNSYTLLSHRRLLIIAVQIAAPAIAFHRSNSCDKNNPVLFSPLVRLSIGQFTCENRIVSTTRSFVHTHLCLSLSPF